MLAVHVEDHPLDYATFAGEIPKGNYGAGTVEIWDTGTFELVEEKQDGGLTVRLHGTASRARGRSSRSPRRRSEELAADPEARGRSAPKGAFRNDYRPMLATLADELPKGDDWLYEVKWDGYRALGYVRAGEARLVSRNGNDLTARFPDVAKALAKAARSPDCVVDGEVCALDDQGRPSFSAMQQGKPGTPIVYAVFDVLEIDGMPVLDLPLTERRARLEALLDARQKTVQVSGFFDDGEGLLAAAVERGLEGVMAKRPESRYVEGKRTRDWLKIKTHGREEFVICGWTKGQGKRAGRFGSLVLGTYRGDELHWVGNCGTGFTERDIDELLEKLEPLRRDTARSRPSRRCRRCARATSCGSSRSSCARSSSRSGRTTGTCARRRSRGCATTSRRGRCVASSRSRRREGRVKLSNLDKVFWPDEGITKGDLLDYYRAVAPVILPHLRDRPFTMRRYPDGADGQGVLPEGRAEAHAGLDPDVPHAQVSTRESPPRKKWIEAPLVNDEDALLWMVNMGCIDMNTWYSRVDRPDRPDFVLFDLDPSPDVGFKETVQVALLVKAALDALGLESFAKTSSADGMHVLVPVERRYTFDDTREFSEIVAGAIARTHRGLATTEWSKAKRRGVLIDSNQNGEGKTIASVYSVRPRPGAPVSTPLRWDEVNEKLDPSAFTMDVVLERVRTHGDLFEGVLTTRQRLDRALKSLR